MKNKIRGYSIIESLVSLSIISIIITIFLIALTNHFNIGKDISRFKSMMTLERIKTEIRKNNEPIEKIIEDETSDNQNIDFSFFKINDEIYKITISVSSIGNKNPITETIIIHQNGERQ